MPRAAIDMPFPALSSVALCNAGVQDEVAAEASAEEYRQNDFKNDLTAVVISAFVQAYGDGNADITADTVCSSCALPSLPDGVTRTFHLPLLAMSRCIPGLS